MFGFKKNELFWHPSLKGPAFYPTPEAPQEFKKWVYKLIEVSYGFVSFHFFHRCSMQHLALITSNFALSCKKDWYFENVCCAHNSNLIGGGREALLSLIRCECSKEIV
jgi:hypothetical protein